MRSSSRRRVSAAYVGRWGDHQSLFKKGFLPVPQAFFEFAAKLDPPISPIQRLLILHFMSFKWAVGPPYMSFVTLGKHLGMTAKMVSRHANKLQKSGYLRIEYREGRSCKFHLNSLFDALNAAVPPRRSAASERAVKRQEKLTPFRH